MKRTGEEELSLVDQFRMNKRKNQLDSVADKNSKSQKWFVQKIKDLKYKSKSKPVVGSMVTYAYDPKYKTTLPYYDKFPLIILLGPISKGTWLGLNLHYITPKQREYYLEQILKHVNTKKLAPNSVFKIDWSKVKGLQFSDHMIKRYLIGHVRSSINAVPPNEWVNAVYLPTSQFMSKGKRFSSRKVWKDAKRKY